MKKSIFVAFISFLILSCTGKTAIGYNDTIIKPQLEVVSQLDSIFKPGVEINTIKHHREKIIQIADKALTNIKKLEDFKGNTTYKNAGIKYFTYVSNYYLTTPNVDSLIFKFNSPERIESMPENEFYKTQSDFNQFLQLENELLEEQKKFAEEFHLNLK